MQTLAVRHTRPDDLPAVLALLAEASLPTEGVEEHFTDFLVAGETGRVTGAIGLEIYGDTALLRSAVVAPAHRSAGLGSALFEDIRALAAARGVRRLILLTNTAEEYFRRKGFVSIPAASVRGPVTASVEFTGACPSTAVCMELRL
jgi:amino-acid N-acetyltransferase